MVLIAAALSASLFSLICRSSLAFTVTVGRPTSIRANTSSATMASASSATPSPPKTVVIAGGGVIGTSTAYYLAKNHGIKSVLVDPTGIIAPAASGKAGGFLALDWNDHTPPVGRLARRSFALHAELASDENFGADKIMYRRLTCAAVIVDPNASGTGKPSGRKLKEVDWAQDDAMDDNVVGMRPLGDEDTIAQVHPKMLCDALFGDARATAGCDIVKGEVESPIYEDGKLVGAKLKDGTTIAGDALLYATGPWTKQVFGVKYHSVLVPTPRVLTQSVFFSGCGDPEVYPRPDGTAYCTGFPDDAVRVTERPGEEEVRDEKVDMIVDSVRAASGRDGALSAEPSLTQACYLPTTPDGIPMMGAIPGKDGCYVAAGHGCWGILLGPGTGETMAALIATGKTTEHVDISWFDPGRFE
mmetsp:Transcript_37339/g.81747  ORF Transcript_37339/g.81747 Transcript_37339/m.81747 type:complete len:415 (-) Transcript_37339:34-1278(-)